MHLAVLSPGVPTDLPVVCMDERDRSVSGEKWNLHMSMEKEMYLQLPEQTEKRRLLALLGEIMQMLEGQCICSRKYRNPYTDAAADTTEET